MGSKNNILDGGKKYRLTRYLEVNKDRIVASCPTYGSVAKEVTDALGFVCTESNVRGAAEDLGLTWRGRRGSGADALSRTRSTRVLARAIIEIADALDINIDPNVLNIANGQKMIDPSDHADGGS